MNALEIAASPVYASGTSRPGHFISWLSQEDLGLKDLFLHLQVCRN